MSDDDVEYAFDEFDRSWAESHGVFERRAIRRELELVVMPGRDAIARAVASRRGVPASVQPVIHAVPDHPRGPHEVWRWVWREVEFMPVQGGQRPTRLEAIGEAMLGWNRQTWIIAGVGAYVVVMTFVFLAWQLTR